jgi:uncharacterized protein (DUF2225 family)
VYRLRNHHYVENSIEYKLVQKRQQAVERNRLYRARQRQRQVSNNNDEETVKNDKLQNDNDDIELKKYS